MQLCPAKHRQHILLLLAVQDSIKRKLNRYPIESPNMYTVRTLDGSLKDILDPAFRKIEFGDSPAIVTVCTHIRALWTTLPTRHADTTTLGATAEADPWAVARSHKLKETRDGFEGVESNPDTDEVNTPWREELYRAFNHVFFDVMKWLPGVNCSVGHFHPPSHESFYLECPHTGSNESPLVLRKKWERNILLLPAYVRKGLKIKATMHDEDQAEEQVAEGAATGNKLGVFDGTNGSEIWYWVTAIMWQR